MAARAGAGGASGTCAGEGGAGEGEGGAGAGESEGGASNSGGYGGVASRGAYGGIEGTGGGAGTWIMHGNPHCDMRSCAEQVCIQKKSSPPMPPAPTHCFSVDMVHGKEHSPERACRSWQPIVDQRLSGMHSISGMSSSSSSPPRKRRHTPLPYGMLKKKSGGRDFF